ncbi:ADP-ribosylation factor 3 [Habropoda laboriosa]|uniref:ADP-ribosylation factor 3 n=1 Tax=Habropoda laboriosa TaxID=597456 RepID=A0A0L7RHM7_9HYME|nr:PREDICTED: ADP-ribosylation factor 3-like [Habropoda laboriosa]KOC70303.1 ADP-ribosylation factor 3 [Habropoda laboriosa]
MIQNVFRNGQRIFWIGCACMGTYIAYRYWKKRELLTIDEGFEEVSKIDDSHEKRVLLLGLEGSGKTSIINQICVANGDETFYTVPPKPTEGSSVYRIKNGMVFYNIWDIGGSDATRKYWTAFLQDTDLLLFVVDASDPTKLSLAASILKQLLSDSRMDDVPILIVANKQDCPNTLKPEEVKQALDLLSISPHKHKVEIIGCQTRPIPEMPENTTECTWYHASVDAVRKKILHMAKDSMSAPLFC